MRCDQVDSKGRMLSAYTISTETAALSKLFGIRPDDPDRFKPPVRRREDIRRSRLESSMDKHFSKTNNAELINFEKGVGLRREGLSNLTGDCLYDRTRITETINKIESKPVNERTAAEKKLLPALRETEIYKDKGIQYYVYAREKGGRVRLAPVLPEYQDAIVERMKKTPPGQKVWNHVSKNYDVHADRSEYCKDIYRMFARPIEEIPFDAVNKGSGKRYQSGVYVCRKDERGRKLDKHAMLVASKAMGHNRIDIIAVNYLYGL